MQEVVISFKESNQRIDKFVKKYLNDAPLSFIYKLFRKKDIKINGHWVKQDYLIKENDVLSIYINDEQIKEFNKPKEIVKTPFPHEIIFEDQNILIVNKPRGLLVHGDESEKKLTLANEVINYLYYKDEYNPNEKGFIPAPAHRLDRNTSGLVLFAKNLQSLQILEELFKEKTEIEKHYVALIKGTINEKTTIDKPLLKDAKCGLVKIAKYSQGAQSALTIVKPIKTYKNYTLVDINLITGRTHQIRVHLASIDHPVIGDGKYGDFQENRKFKEMYNFENQFLHAKSLKFKNISGVLEYLSNKTFTSSLPQIEEAILSKLN